jgi:glycosyltransferase involved in cell wall biosynthesis
MIVGPGESLRWLDRVLRRAQTWADRIFVYADGADDDTLHALDRYASVRPAALSMFERNESLVRNRLLEMLDEDLNEGDLVVMLDADEELHSVPGGRSPRGQLLR